MMKTYSRYVLAGILFFGVFCIFNVCVVADGVPQGMISIRVGDVSGWLVNNTDYVLCNSSNAVLYPDMVPDLSGQFVVGYTASDVDYDTVGETGGEAFHTLLTAEMPAHTHTMTFYTAGTGALGPVRRATAAASGAYTSSSTGSDNAHENRPPYYVVAFVCKIGNATRCNSTNLTKYENIVDAVGTHDSVYNVSSGWKVWANYTGNPGTGGSGLLVDNPNPANSTFLTNFLMARTSGLTTAVDVSGNTNFTVLSEANLGTGKKYMNYSDGTGNWNTGGFGAVIQEITLNKTFVLKGIKLPLQNCTMGTGDDLFYVYILKPINNHYYFNPISSSVLNSSKLDDDSYLWITMNMTPVVLYNNTKYGICLYSSSLTNIVLWRGDTTGL